MHLQGSWPQGSMQEGAAAAAAAAATCQLCAHRVTLSGCGWGAEYYEARAAELGQDPLREDADPEALWAAVQKSRKSIGLCLMSQELIAGVGNIFRAEILFKVSCGQRNLFRMHCYRCCSSQPRLRDIILWIPLG